MLATYLYLPAHNFEKGPEASDLISTLDSIGDNGERSNLGKIFSKCLRKEWSYFVIL